MLFQRPRIYTQIKFANNAKTNHIMVSSLIWSAKDRWKSCFKENAKTYSKNSTTQGNIRISGLKKRLRNLYEENLQDELYQLENKQAKGAKLCPTIRWKLEGEKCSKTFFKVYTWKKEYAKPNKIWIYIDDNKSEHSSIPIGIFKFEKENFWEILHQRSNFQNRHYWIS